MLLTLTCSRDFVKITWYFWHINNYSFLKVKIVIVEVKYNSCMFHVLKYILKSQLEEM